MTNAGGAANINGALTANGTGRAYTVGQKYAVVTAAGGVSGAFTSFSVNGSFGATMPTVVYDANDVFLLLAPTVLKSHLASGTPANVIDIDNANTTTLPPALQNLSSLSPAQLSNTLTQLLGEDGTGAQESGFQIMNSFMSLMLDPYAENRGGGFGRAAGAASGPALGFGPTATCRLTSACAAVVKAPPRAYAPRWNTWATAFGGVDQTRGDPSGVGSHNATNRAGGVAAGVDYHRSPDTLLGFALAGGGTSWGLSQGLSGGSSNVFQAGAFGAHQAGAAYVSGALAFADCTASTSRSVTVAGADTLTASFNAQSYGGRPESGYHFAAMPFTLTPYIW